MLVKINNWILNSQLILNLLLKHSKMYQLVWVTLWRRLRKVLLMISRLWSMRIIRIRIRNRSQRVKKLINRSKSRLIRMRQPWNYFHLTLKRKYFINSRASITLENLQKLSKQSKTGEGRFVFTNFHITKPNQKIGFRIKTLKNWIGLGVAIR